MTKKEKENFKNMIIENEKLKYEITFFESLLYRKYEKIRELRKQNEAKQSLIDWMIKWIQSRK